MGADDGRAAVSAMLMLAMTALLLGRRRAGFRAFGGTLLFLLVPVATIAALWRSILQVDDGTVAIIGAHAKMLALVGHPVLGLTAPLLLAIALAGAALARRVPVSVGVVRGMARATVPAAAVLAILYAGSVVVTARTDARMSTILERQIEHEGRYYAEVLGRTWPE